MEVMEMMEMMEVMEQRRILDQMKNITENSEPPLLISVIQYQCLQSDLLQGILPELSWNLLTWIFEETPNSPKLSPLEMLHQTFTAVAGCFFFLQLRLQ